VLNLSPHLVASRFVNTGKRTTRDTQVRLRKEIEVCRACPRLVRWRETVARERKAAYRDEAYWGKPIAGFGDDDARVVVLGLAPGAHGANRTGRVFTGDRSGDWLFRAMHKAGLANSATSRSRNDGLKLRDAWVTVAVRCAPPDNKPSPLEKKKCSGYLDRELAMLSNKRVVVCLGNFAYVAACEFFGVSPRPKFAHGAEVQVPAERLESGRERAGVTLVCSYHPSQQNTFTGRLTERMLDDVFARATRIARS
jgi:uracil-DNA glycosylase family 4